MCVRALSCLVVYDSVFLWTVACQAPLSLGFIRQEYWRGLPFSPLGDLPDPRIEPGPPALQADSLPTEQVTVGGPDFYPRLSIKKFCLTVEAHLLYNFLLRYS